MNKKAGRLKTLQIILLLGLLILQILSLAGLGMKRNEYHIDEIYSYILSNSYDADKISNDPEFQDRWIDGESLLDFVTVQEGERFAYDRVYYNNSLDAHPPLFYYLLHTVSSFFPDTFSRWLGLGLNIALFALSQALLFVLSRRIWGDSLWALLPAAMYGGSMLGTDTVMFARMYMLLTMFTVLLLLVHYDMWRRSVRKRDYFYCFAVCFLGVYTQYFFAVIAFFTAAVFCIYLISRKEWKKLLSYALSMLLAVGLVFVVYPAAVSQICGSATNNVGAELSGGLLDFSGWGSALGHMAAEFAKTGLYGLFYVKYPAAALIVLTVILAVIYRKKDPFGGEAADSRHELICLGLCALLFILSFALVAHVIGKFLYLRYFYNLVPLACLGCTFVLKLITDRIPVSSGIIALGLAAVFALSSLGLFRGGKCSLIYEENPDVLRDNLELCSTRPVVVMDSSTVIPTGNFMLLTKCPELYMTDPEEPQDYDRIAGSRELENGIAFVIPGENDWIKGYDGDEFMQNVIDESELLSEYKKAGEMFLGTIYIAY
ncbi:MAG: hypothetical protein ACOX68_06330 [Candidatus Limivicinus sp.]|jgi:uncharacterized membrane protein